MPKEIYIISLIHHKDEKRELGVYGAYSSLKLAETALPKLFNDSETMIDIDGWNGYSQLIYTDTSTWLIEKMPLDEM